MASELRLVVGVPPGIGATTNIRITTEAQRTQRTTCLPLSSRPKRRILSVRFLASPGADARSLLRSPPPVDQTHDPALTSWVESAQGPTDFPIQNLPFGVFRPLGD